MGRRCATGDRHVLGSAPQPAWGPAATEALSAFTRTTARSGTGEEGCQAGGVAAPGGADPIPAGIAAEIAPYGGVVEEHRAPGILDVLVPVAADADLTAELRAQAATFLQKPFSRASLLEAQRDAPSTTPGP